MAEKASDCMSSKGFGQIQHKNKIGVTEWFWRSQIWDGKLPFVQVGRKMMIDSKDIETFIQKHKMYY